MFKAVTTMTFRQTKADTWGEDVLSQKWKRCTIDTMIKLGTGFLLGALATRLFYRGSKWPIILGSAFGFGMGYENCEKDINESLTYEKAIPKEVDKARGFKNGNNKEPAIMS